MFESNPRMTKPRIRLRTVSAASQDSDEDRSLVFRTPEQRDIWELDRLLLNYRDIAHIVRVSPKLILGVGQEGREEEVMDVIVHVPAGESSLALESAKATKSDPFECRRTSIKMLMRTSSSLTCQAVLLDAMAVAFTTVALVGYLVAVAQSSSGSHLVFLFPVFALLVGVVARSLLRESRLKATLSAILMMRAQDEADRTLAAEIAGPAEQVVDRLLVEKEHTPTGERPLSLELLELADKAELRADSIFTKGVAGVLPSIADAITRRTIRRK